MLAAELLKKFILLKWTLIGKFLGHFVILLNCHPGVSTEEEAPASDPAAVEDMDSQRAGMEMGRLLTTSEIDHRRHHRRHFPQIVCQSEEDRAIRRSRIRELQFQARYVFCPLLYNLSGLNSTE